MRADVRRDLGIVHLHDLGDHREDDHQNHRDRILGRHDADDLTHENLVDHRNDDRHLPLDVRRVTIRGGDVIRDRLRDDHRMYDRMYDGLHAELHHDLDGHHKDELNDLHEALHRELDDRYSSDHLMDATDGHCVNLLNVNHQHDRR